MKVLASQFIKMLQDGIAAEGDLEVKGDLMIPHSHRFGPCNVVLAEETNWACKPPLKTKYFNVGLVDFNKGIPDEPA